jgi:outer membrane lipoprotein-sorting protein
MSIRRRTVLATRAAALSLPAAVAATPGPSPGGAAAGLSAVDRDDVDRAVAYLQSLTNVRARFIQTDARGGRLTGRLRLQRPGKARFDYDPPSGMIVASDGVMVSVVDHRLKTMRVFALSQTPLALFLARDIRLDRGVEVHAVRHEPGAMTILASDGRGKAPGAIALRFSESPFALTGWILKDGRGGAVEVRLEDLSLAAPAPAAAFRLRDPRTGDQPVAP